MARGPFNRNTRHETRWANNFDCCDPALFRHLTHYQFPHLRDMRNFKAGTHEWHCLWMNNEHIWHTWQPKMHNLHCLNRYISLFVPVIHLSHKFSICWARNWYWMKKVYKLTCSLALNEVLRLLSGPAPKSIIESMHSYRAECSSWLTKLQHDQKTRHCLKLHLLTTPNLQFMFEIRNQRVRMGTGRHGTKYFFTSKCVTATAQTGRVESSSLQLGCSKLVETGIDL